MLPSLQPTFSTSFVAPPAPFSRTYLSFLTGIFALTAFILMWVGGLRCNYVKFTDISGTSEPISREFGIWFYQYWSTVVSLECRV